MATLTSASARLWEKSSDPGASETGAELGNYFLNTTSKALFYCSVPTFGAQVWNQLALKSGSFTSINVQKFTGSGTYTPTAGMLYCTIEVVGGGGGGGGAGATGVGDCALGGGGGAGGYARKTVTAATIGGSQTVTVGGAGSGGTGSGSGTGGGTTSVGSIVSATGGSFGPSSANTTVLAKSVAGGAGGAGSSGDFNTTGGAGGSAFNRNLGGFGGVGGNSFYGGGALGVVSNSNVVSGNAANSYGGGGGGCSSAQSQSAGNGGAGFAGIVVITEFI